MRTAEQICGGLARCYLRNGVDDPREMAALAEPIIRLELEARDREIARLQDLVTTYVMTGEPPGGTP